MIGHDHDRKALGRDTTIVSRHGGKTGAQRKRTIGVGARATRTSHTTERAQT